MRRIEHIFSRWKSFRRDKRGAVLVEFAVSLALFLLLTFGLVDYGRMGFNYVMAEKAVQIAARVAAVRPPVCPGVPQTNAVNAGNANPPRFGTKCNAVANTCAAPAAAVCVGSAANATSAEIWGRIQPLLPPNATIANIQFRYEFDVNLGFLGGPYIPMVTAEITNLNFTFATPLGALAPLAGGNGQGLGGVVPFPTISASMPGEDLALGTAG